MSWKESLDSQIARKLYEQGLIKNETVFKLLSKINGMTGLTSPVRISSVPTFHMTR